MNKKNKYEIGEDVFYFYEKKLYCTENKNVIGRIIEFEKAEIAGINKHFIPWVGTFWFYTLIDKNINSETRTEVRNVDEERLFKTGIEVHEYKIKVYEGLTKYLSILKKDIDSWDY